LIEVLVPKTAVSPTPAPQILAPTEAAEKMRLNEQTVMKWCREGRLQASKIGGKWLIPQESVDAFIRKSEVIHGRRGGK
jgi:excisionase family DNA binding protein